MTEDERITLARESIERDLQTWMIENVLGAIDTATAYERVSGRIDDQVVKINAAPLEARIRFLAELIDEDSELLAEQVDAVAFKGSVELSEGDPTVFDIHWHADVKMKPHVGLINVTFSLS